MPRTARTLLLGVNGIMHCVLLKGKGCQKAEGERQRGRTVDRRTSQLIPSFTAVKPSDGIELQDKKPHPKAPNLKP